MNISETIIIKLASKKDVRPPVLASLKRALSKKLALPCPPNSALLQAYHKLVEQGKIKQNQDLERLLRTRKVRSLSGVVSVSVLTKPYPCPGKCLYCPTQKGLPKSYLEGEPAVMRAMANKFNPYLQVQSRLKALQATGHTVSKIELIIIGGTWSAIPEKYQEWFIKECFRAANNGALKSRSLEQEQKRNEKAKHRIIGITIETRPDFINEEEVRRLRGLGVTRVELGVQNLDDNILEKNIRGHRVSETIRATRLLKDAGFKVCYHMMPNLLGSDFKKDEEMFAQLFENQSFQPDFLKIYPCVVLKEAPLYQVWLKKKYRAYTDRQLINLLKKTKQKIPPYCRIIRIYRDIPSPKIIAGSKISNLRQVVARELKSEGKRCWCIRCREAKEGVLAKSKLKLFRQDYTASGGKEIFLSFEDKNRQRLYSLLRLRIPSKGAPILFSALKNAALIREVHTYGETLDFGEKQKNSPQHRRLGKELIKKAEEIAVKEFGFSKIAVIAGVGTRNYYRRLGYRLQNTYLVKRLSS